MTTKSSLHRGAAALAIFLCGLGALGDAAAQSRQTILGPGMYVFQTRTRSATCGDDSQNGYVSSFVAPIHGIPGSREMSMNLLNTEYWSTWRLTVNRQMHILGLSTLDGGGANAPTNRFDVSRQGDRFVGTGTRQYMSGGRRCEVSYDALLRRIDLL